MSAQNQPQLAENAPLLIKIFMDGTLKDEPDFNTKPRRPPEKDTPPRGASRDLGGACPECQAPMKTRLRAQFGSTHHARLELTAYCTDPECCLCLRGHPADFALEEVEV